MFHHHPGCNLTTTICATVFIVCMCACLRMCVCVCGGGGLVVGVGRCMREGAIRLINRYFLHIYYYVLKNIHLLCYYATLIFVILPTDKM